MADNTFLVKLGMNTQELVNGVNKANGVLSNFQNSIKAIGIGISAIQIGSFVKDVSRLAGEAQGVKAAFDRLPDSIKLMNDLKDATGGTVSELELMKRSVMASNFDISLKALPQLLEFATLRARQTGQSVNYLVDSIVTGIGRKSKLILDNLGISAVQLTEALGGASAASSTIGEVAEAVGRIATENLKKMGSLTDDAAVKSDRLAASWENLKVAIGNTVNNIGGNKILDFLTAYFKRWEEAAGGAVSLRTLNLAILNFNQEGGRFNDGGKEITRMMRELSDMAKKAGQEVKFLTDNTTGATTAILKAPKPNYIWINGDEIKEEIRSVGYLEDQIKLLNEEIKLSGSKSQIKKYQDEIVGLQKEIDVLLGKEEKLNKALTSNYVSKMNQPSTAADLIPASQANKPMTPANEAMDETNELLIKRVENGAKKLKEVTEQMKEQIMSVAQTYAQVGDDIGQGFGNAISGTISFAQAMERMASSVVASIERVVLARMIEKSFMEGGPTPVAIALAAAGFGLVKALFNRIGRNSSYSASPSSSGMSSSYSGAGSNVTFRIAGTDLVGAIDNTNRLNARTKGYTIS